MQKHKVKFYAIATLLAFFAYSGLLFLILATGKFLLDWDESYVDLLRNSVVAGLFLSLVTLVSPAIAKVFKK